MEKEKNYGLDLGILAIQNTLNILNKGITEDLTLIELRNGFEKVLFQMRESKYK